MMTILGTSEALRSWQNVDLVNEEIKNGLQRANVKQIVYSKLDVAGCCVLYYLVFIHSYKDMDQVVQASASRASINQRKTEDIQVNTVYCCCLNIRTIKVLFSVAISVRDGASIDNMYSGSSSLCSWLSVIHCCLWDFPPSTSRCFSRTTNIHTVNSRWAKTWSSTELKDGVCMHVCTLIHLSTFAIHPS